FTVQLSRSFAVAFVCASVLNITTPLQSCQQLFLFILYNIYALIFIIIYYYNPENKHKKTQ
ncbi:MAG: hypothetical protein K1W39_01465, partial [Lachnospiraceae bacterium]